MRVVFLKRDCYIYIHINIYMYIYIYTIHRIKFGYVQY